MGLIHIYCGDGKGKTTAALGLAVRAAGAGMRVHIVQLMKGRFSSELNSLPIIPGITVERCDRDYGFPAKMTEADRAGITLCHNGLLRRAETLLPERDMLILDEFNSAYRHGLIDRELAGRLVLQKPPELELVLTGRGPDAAFLAAADYVSEINAIKHPYHGGISARLGIEY